MLETMIVPAITATVWVVCRLLKLWIADKDRKIIPTVATLIGLVLGFATVGVTLDGALSGMVSGLAATGANELVKQYRKDTEVPKEGE